MIEMCLYSTGLFLTLIIGLVSGFFLGKRRELKVWMDRKRIAIPGQRIWIQNLGEVLVLGYSEDEEFVDFVEEVQLDGRSPIDLTEDELNKITISVPTLQFLTQIVPDAVKQAARY